MDILIFLGLGSVFFVLQLVVFAFDSASSKLHIDKCEIKTIDADGGCEAFTENFLSQLKYNEEEVE